MKTLTIIVSDQNTGQKIDKAIVLAGTELTRRHIRRILDQGGISCNGKPILMASQTVNKGDKITLRWLPELTQKNQEPPSLTEKDILYWENEILAINKPAGIASVPTVSEQTPYVKKALAPLVKAKGYDSQKLSACHRLDKEPSGVLVFALSSEKADWVMQQFRNKSVRKTYYALCYNIPKQKKWDLKCYLSSIDKKTGMVKIVKSGGYSSYSAFELISFSERHRVSLIRIHPLTGRSHQIRVHLLHSKLPIIGDKKYALANTALNPTLKELSLSHHFLHAASLEIPMETQEEKLTIQAPFPKIFLEFMQKSGLSLP